jgi:hypothetical protein
VCLHLFSEIEHFKDYIAKNKTNERPIGL